jgi:DNA-binding transcriptional regulator/RsmH inhibitor MraZ
MALFSFNRAIDKNGVLVIPRELRELLGTTAVMVQTFPYAIELLPEAKWALVEARIREVIRRNNNPAALEFVLKLTANAFEVIPDARARLKPPARIREEIGIRIADRVAVLGLGDRVRLFSWNRWRELVRNPEGEVSTSILRQIQVMSRAPPSPVISEVVEHLTRFATDARLRDWDSCDSRRLELDVGAALEMANIGVVEITQPSADGGADLLVYIPSDGGHRILVVQCKSGRARASVKELRELIGVVGRDGAHLGLLVAVAGFTSSARDEARMSRIPVRLADTGSVASWLSRGTLARVLGVD